jgi:hypothetical protein
MRSLFVMTVLWSVAAAAGAEPLSVPPLVPAAPAEAPAATAAHDEAPVLAERPTFDFCVGPHALTRAFGPSDGTRFMASYAGGAAGVGVASHWFPLASAPSGAGGNLGLFGEGVFTLGLVTTFNGQQYASNAALLRGGLAWRFPLGRTALLVHAGVAYQGFQMGQVSTSQVQRPPIPDVGFLGPRAGLGLQVALTRTFALEAGLAFSWAAASGEVASFIDHPTSLGLDASVGLSWAMLPHLHLRLSGDLSHFFITGSTHAAADQYLGGTLALAFSS